MAPPIARIRARISRAKASPSAVAVIGPSSNRTVLPAGKKKRLTRKALAASGRAKRRTVRTSRHSTPATAAGSRTATATTTAGPSSPPMTTAATAVAVAIVAFVSGFSRW
jgi:hypothetical protein